MAIAKGRSSVRVEIDILKDTLEKMIHYNEANFNRIINSIKEELSAIEHDSSISSEERHSIATPFYNELDKYIEQRDLSRNKLIICIYSICEIALASICGEYYTKIIKKGSSRKKRNYYLTDYLYTINPKYTSEWKDANNVSTIIRNLRNYLTHCVPDEAKAIKIIDKLNKRLHTHFSQIDGIIIIQDIEDLLGILELCYQLLVKAEQIAQTHQKINNQ